MIEILLQIPGPIFLKYYIILSVICIVLGWLLVNADGSTKYSLPRLTFFGTTAIAALRGGTNAVIRYTIFSLWNRKLVNITKHWWKHDDIEVVAKPSEKIILKSIEGEIYKFLQSTEKSPNPLKDTGLRGRIEQYLEPTYKEFEQLRLIRSKSIRVWAWIVTILIFLVIYIIGGTKLYLGITHNHPVGFLIILLIIWMIVLFKVLKPWSISTRLGRRYLKSLKKRFGRFPSFSVAISGVGILAYTSLYGFFGGAFPSSIESGYVGYGGDIGGGCGGGCGDGCGGGGCGGCGGG